MKIFSTFTIYGFTFGQTGFAGDVFCTIFGHYFTVLNNEKCTNRFYIDQRSDLLRTKPGRR